MGGGALNQLLHFLLLLGLSPRGRGSHHKIRGHSVGRGSIPAWAGEPCFAPAYITTSKVYPRVGGGAWRDLSHRRRYLGLSPRGRGSQIGAGKGRSGEGSIPAWAGEPTTARRSTMLRWVYPRVGGGARDASRSAVRLSGLSPRGRGSHAENQTYPPDHGSIPAWAGEPCCVTDNPHRTRVYPRVGGGALSSAIRVHRARGLSPRGRGSLTRADHDDWTIGSIPAWAGEPGTTLGMRP